ncbi:MAG: phosphotransferase [Rhabdochlamydiaceae bacterium]
MKKIDLHIHTVPTYCDTVFDFSLEKLKDYVTNAGLDAIAITNHNCFDLQQFEQIVAGLQIMVLPGIEVSLNQGQVLVIGDGKDLADYGAKTSQIANKNKKTGDSLSAAEVAKVFGDLQKYLVIPHYEKNPAIAGVDLESLKDFISAGEVASAKKFIRLTKGPNGITPVLFSDVRISDTLDKFPTRQTYVDCGDMTFSSLKLCLRDKAKVALSEKDGNRLFQVFDDGQKLSTGLNILLGERSTGKTHTLDRISDTLERTKYIRQFSLVQADEAAYEKEFNNSVAKQRSVFADEFLASYKSVLNDVANIDLSHNDQLVAKYIETLLRSADEAEKKDAFSKTTLFDETPFPISEENTLNALIHSVRQLIENVEYRPIIEKHLELAVLKALACELIMILRGKELKKKKEKSVNELVKTIKGRLKLKTSATQIEDVDLYKVKIEQAEIKKFAEVTKLLQQETIISDEGVQGFRVVAKRRPFNGAMELKNVSKQKVGFKDAFVEYDNPYEYLRALKANEALVPSEFYKYFVMIDYEILNKDGAKVSGGERSEFRLLQEIKYAKNYEILLIDEPESSFDNLFLKGQVNQIIKEIAETMPVVVVTHNSTVGASIKPDFILHTSK